MLPAVHVAQVLLALFCVRLVRRKLLQVQSGGPRGARAAERLVAAVEHGDAEALAKAVRDSDCASFQRDLVEAAMEALRGGGDVGAFVHTAALDACHQAIAGVRMIRGAATLAGTVGLLGAMVHHFTLIHGDHGPGAAALAAAEGGSNRGALVSMGLGLGTALGLIVAARVTRTRVLARLAEIRDLEDLIETAVTRSGQWTAPADQ